MRKLQGPVFADYLNGAIAGRIIVVKRPRHDALLLGKQAGGQFNAPRRGAKMTKSALAGKDRPGRGAGAEDFRDRAGFIGIPTDGAVALCVDMVDRARRDLCSGKRLADRPDEALAGKSAIETSREADNLGINTGIAPARVLELFHDQDAAAFA